MTTEPIDVNVLRDYRPQPGELEGRIILITGAGDGIGAALARAIGALGATVILTGRKVSKLEKVYDAIEEIDGAPRPSIAVLDLESANSQSYITLADSLADLVDEMQGEGVGPDAIRGLDVSDLSGGGRVDIELGRVRAVPPAQADGGA